MKRIFKKIYISVICISTLMACEVVDFDLQENPNLLNPTSSDPNFLLNELQFLFQDIMGDMILNTDDVMRYESLTGTYNDEVDPDVLRTEWERYFEALSIARVIETQAASDPGLTFHNAISKLLLGYLTVTLVDYNGAIPFSQAAMSEEFPNPVLDDGADLYTMVLADIDQAIIDINASTNDVTNDLFYNNNRDRWEAFANSFKLRLLIQTRLASGEVGVADIQSQINALLNSNIIDTEAEDFQYNFTAVNEPESRHPYFVRGYLSGFSQYIGNYFMFTLRFSKNVIDPRIRYYLYRQSDVDPFSGPPFLACQGDPEVDFCFVGDQYWGLDHGETRTGRGDNFLRTVYGVYPGGGTFDEDQFDRGANTVNSGGAGILPLLTSSYIKFLSAEAALMLNTNGDPVTLLEEAIRNSMNKVLNFGNVNSSLEPTAADVDAYVAEVIANYTAATSNEERLDIIITEFYLAAYGNSIESYNAYRRTGFPSSIQESISGDVNFPRSFPYSDEEVNLNSSISQKQNTVRVFWDTNPEGFIN
ncbi:SusD/RagB family nutrient-binding outer membrane lipoprotein [Flavobacteriaceae bacterium R38]|nr:SusD/RagB family nutrient-binding outer membrane lipoprotein [Flavobacteriaceae bacterium R38]